MWVRVTLIACCLVLGSNGLERASLRRANDHTGRCQYTFTVDSPTEPGCPGTSWGPELENVKSRLALLEELLGRSAGGEEAGAGATPDAEVEQERNELRRENEELGRQVQELQSRLEELMAETESLKNRPCSPVPVHALQGFGQSKDSDPAFQFGGTAFQELKAEVSEVPAPRRMQESVQNQTGCGELVSIGEPVTHRKADGISGKYGMWYQDPEANSAPYGPQTVWRIDTVGKDVKQLFAYENMEQLVRGFPSKVLVLPDPVESTGATIYRGSLYYQRKRSRTLLRFDLASQNIAARQELPHAGFHGQYPYSWGGYTDIDLAVDEKGLWAIYSTNKAKGAIVVAQLDPETLAVKKTWETNIRKNMVANTFMVCGRLYTVASYSAANTTLNFVFDTADGESKAISVPFQNRYNYNSMIDYNPAKRKLYAWDNFHMITYDVQLGRPSVH